MCNSHNSRAIISSRSRQCPSPIPAKIRLPAQHPVSVWKDQILYLFPGLFTADSSTGQANPRKSNPWQCPGHPCTAAEIYSHGWGHSNCIKFHLNSISQQQPCRNTFPQLLAGVMEHGQLPPRLRRQPGLAIPHPPKPRPGARSMCGHPSLSPTIQRVGLAPSQDLIPAPSQDLILAPREDLAPWGEPGGAEPLGCLSLRDPEPQRGQSHLTQ